MINTILYGSQVISTPIPLRRTDSMTIHSQFQMNYREHAVRSSPLESNHREHREKNSIQINTTPEPKLQYSSSWSEKN
jgi:hypothetical protein